MPPSPPPCDLGTAAAAAAATWFGTLAPLLVSLSTDPPRTHKKLSPPPPSPLGNTTTARETQNLDVAIEGQNQKRVPHAWPLWDGYASLRSRAAQHHMAHSFHQRGHRLRVLVKRASQQWAGLGWAGRGRRCCCRRRRGRHHHHHHPSTQRAPRPSQFKRLNQWRCITYLRKACALTLLSPPPPTCAAPI